MSIVYDTVRTVVGSSKYRIYVEQGIVYNHLFVKRLSVFGSQQIYYKQCSGLNNDAVNEAEKLVQLFPNHPIFQE